MSRTEPRGDAGARTRELATQLKWLTLFRVTLFTILLGATVGFSLQDESELSDRLYMYVYYLCTITYIVSFGYTLAIRFLRTTRQYLTLTYLQFTGDLVLAAALVLVTGGTDSAFTFFFSLVIIGGAIVLFRLGAVYLAAVSTGLLAIIGIIEIYDPDGDGLLKVFRLAFLLYEQDRHEGGEVWRRVTYNVVVNGLAFFGVAILASWLSEQLRRSAVQIRSQHERLQELRALHRHIVNSVPTGLITFDQERRITSVNAAAARLMAVQEEEIIDHDVTEFFRDLKFALENPGTGGVIREESAMAINRRRVYFGWSLSPLSDANGEQIGHTFMFQDVTRVRELEHNMRRSEKMAAIGELSAAIAHEIRNPLAAISGCVEMMSRAPNVRDSDRRLMTIVQRETQQLNQWITDFLGYSRPPPMRMQVIDFDLLVRDAIEVFRQDTSIVKRGIEVVYDSVGPVHVLADHSRMKQVVWNLLTNAEQSMESGRIEVSMGAALASSRPTVDLVIRDQGSGISKEDLERIFEPFFTTKERGTGLGLAVMHRIIEDHDGRIGVESTVGVGTTFTITLPLTAPDLSELRDSDTDGGGANR